MSWRFLQIVLLSSEHIKRQVKKEYRHYQEKTEMCVILRRLGLIVAVCQVIEVYTASSAPRFSLHLQPGMILIIYIIFYNIY